MKNDLLLRLDVVAELLREATLTDAAIGVEVHHGIVKLAGHVSAAIGKIKAEQAARRVEGVRTVVMDLDVIYSAENVSLGPDIAA